MKILGIDQSLNSTGITFINDNKKIIKFHNIKNYIDTYRQSSKLIYMGYSIYNYICKYNPDVIIFEQFAFSRHSSSTTKLAELVGFVEGLCANRRSKVFKVGTLSAAKSLLEAGKLKKKRKEFLCLL